MLSVLFCVNQIGMKEILLLTILCFIPQSLLAEFICTADVGYNWERVTDQKKNTKEKLQTIVEQLVASGETEEIARERAQITAPPLLRKVEQTCLEDHQDIATCISTKLSRITSVLATLSFNARRNLEDGIKADCDKQQGECCKSFMTELKCIKKIEQLDVAREDSTKKGKDKGKAKGKKKK